MSKTYNTYEELRQSKLHTSLLLFLLLNIAFSLFYVVSAINNSRQPSAAAIIVAALSLTVLVISLFRMRSYAVSLNYLAIIIGISWAWHILFRFNQLATPDKTFLLYSLMTVFFISAITLADNLLAFCLHSLPSAVTVLVLDEFSHIVMLLFTIVLPLISFSLHHLMQNRSEAFTIDLVKRLSEEREKFSDLSMIDPLTGLYNRRGLHNRLEGLLGAGGGPGCHYLLLLDIDHFKAYNDNYGHSMGDKALTAVAVAIRDAVRSRDVVVRYGGEEFLVLLIDVDETEALTLAENVRLAVLDLKIPHLYNQEASTTVTLSVGIASLTGANIDASLTAADQALYQAKHQGRNAVKFAGLPVGEKSPSSAER
ncbi:GGDEF domain-containing protein [Sodalis endosymbiont of Spalangia cameroni]|uniref:GGDEF domain-containing protein n=1 Tax=Sodalis praecaptivus TaxID=1239307 RepID=UPI0031F9F0F8